LLQLESDISARQQRRNDAEVGWSHRGRAVAEQTAVAWRSGRPVESRPEGHLLAGLDGGPLMTALDEEDTTDCAKTWRARTSPATEYTPWAIETWQSTPCPRKNEPKCFCRIFYKTWLILEKFGTQYFE